MNITKYISFKLIVLMFLLFFKLKGFYCNENNIWKKLFSQKAFEFYKVKKSELQNSNIIKNVNDLFPTVFKDNRLLNLKEAEYTGKNSEKNKRMEDDLEKNQMGGLRNVNERPQNYFNSSNEKTNTKGIIRDVVGRIKGNLNDAFKKTKTNDFNPKKYTFPAPVKLHIKLGRYKIQKNKKQINSEKNKKIKNKFKGKGYKVTTTKPDKYKNSRYKIKKNKYKTSTNDRKSSGSKNKSNEMKTNQVDQNKFNMRHSTKSPFSQHNSPTRKYNSHRRKYKNHIKKYNHVTENFVDKPTTKRTEERRRYQMITKNLTGYNINNSTFKHSAKKPNSNKTSSSTTFNKYITKKNFFSSSTTNTKSISKSLTNSTYQTNSTTKTSLISKDRLNSGSMKINTSSTTKSQKSKWFGLNETHINNSFTKITKPSVEDIVPIYDVQSKNHTINTNVTDKNDRNNNEYEDGEKKDDETFKPPPIADFVIITVVVIALIICLFPSKAAKRFKCLQPNSSTS